jgi:hypothetical protein
MAGRTKRWPTAALAAAQSIDVAMVNAAINWLGDDLPFSRNRRT